MNINFLSKCKDLQQLKKEYFNLAKQLHPDVKGNINDMQQLNAEYDYLKTILKNDSTIEENKYKETVTSMEEYKNMINDLIRFDDIIIDIVNTWLWIKGNTYNIKDHLKEKGCKWSKGHKCWYWFNGIEESKKCKGNTKHYNKNVATYGIETIRSQGTACIA